MVSLNWRIRAIVLVQPYCHSPDSIPQRTNFSPKHDCVRTITNSTAVGQSNQSPDDTFSREDSYRRRHFAQIDDFPAEAVNQKAIHRDETQTTQFWSYPQKKCREGIFAAMHYCKAEVNALFATALGRARQTNRSHETVAF